MEYRQWGASQLTVSALGLGCMSLSPFYGDISEKEAIDIVRAAYESGITFFDVADIYGFGLSEIRLGKAMASFRDKAVIATKAGIVVDARGAQPKLCGTNTTPGYLKHACERSLKRLGAECIDLYYLHRIDSKTPIEESVQALVDLVREGKIKHIGLSEVSPELIRRAHAVYPITAVQSEYSLWFRNPEKNKVLSTCRELNIGFVPFSPLGRGFLAGAITSVDAMVEGDFRRGLPRFTDECLPTNLNLIEQLIAIAHEVGYTPAQLSLAWLLSRGDDIVPIPGMSKQHLLSENTAAVSISLSVEIIEKLETLFVHDAALGAQFSQGGYNMFATFVEHPESLEAEAT